MAHRKRQSTASSMLGHRVRPGPEPEGQDPALPQGPEPAALRPESPPPPERDCHDHSPDGDSSSDYVNNTSEEEDYDEGLPEEEGGVTYYIRYCPEDDSYLEGVGCDGEACLAHGAGHLQTDECQEAVEEWDSAGPHPHGHGDEGGLGYRGGRLPSPEDDASVLEAQDQEDGVHYCPSEDSYQDYYPPEANGNAGSVSPRRPRRGDGDPDDQEEDIDQIVAEVKMSLSMTSIASAGEASPEHALAQGPEQGPGDPTEASAPGEASRGPSRREGRPKSLSLPPEATLPGDTHRGFKAQTRTPEERPKWPQEQVGLCGPWGGGGGSGGHRTLWCHPRPTLRARPCLCPGPWRACTVRPRRLTLRGAAEPQEVLSRVNSSWSSHEIPLPAQKRSGPSPAVLGPLMLGTVTPTRWPPQAGRTSPSM